MLLVIFAVVAAPAPFVLIAWPLARRVRCHRGTAGLSTGIVICAALLAFLTGGTLIVLLLSGLGDSPPHNANISIRNRTADEFWVVQPSPWQTQDEALARTQGVRRLQPNSTRPSILRLYTENTPRGEGGCMLDPAPFLIAWPAAPPLGSEFRAPKTEEIEVRYRWVARTCFPTDETWLDWDGTDMITTSGPAQLPEWLAPLVGLGLFLGAVLAVGHLYDVREAAGRAPPPTSTF